MPSFGKYFMIKSVMNGNVLDVAGEESDAGTTVFMWDKKRRDNDNQLWWRHAITQTIRSKLNGNCLTATEDGCVVNPYEDGNDYQKWRIEGDRIRSLAEDKFLDIADKSDKKGAKLCIWEYNGGENQQWEFECEDPVCFYIVSELNGKVLDVEGGDKDAGTKVIMYERKGREKDNQLWYEDKNGLIRSKLNDLILDAEGGELTLQEPEEGKESQMWSLDENRIVNAAAPDDVLDIRDQNNEDGAYLVRYAFNEGANQLWKIEYVD